MFFALRALDLVRDCCAARHDSKWSPLGAICVEVLKQLDIIDKIEHFDYMKKHEQPDVRNARGIITGRIVAAFRLRKA